MHELQVESGNWMGALREGRKVLGEEGGLPPGASCAVAPSGVVTIMDAAARRKLVLTPSDDVAAPPAPPSAAQQPPVASAASQAHAQPGAPASVPHAPAQAQAPTASGKKPKFQTVAYTPGMNVPTPAGTASGTPASHGALGASPPVAPATAPSTTAATTTNQVSAAQPPQAQPLAASTSVRSPDAGPVAAPGVVPSSDEGSAKKKRFETVAFMPSSAASDAQRPVAVPVPIAPQEPPSTPVSKPPADATTAVGAPAHKSGTSYALEVQLTRDEEPSAQNPLTYRERAYVIPRGMSVMETEAALRYRLADLQRQLGHAARGKLVHLAAFDHRWTHAPERPPLVVLEWRDWRGEPSVDYPAAARDSTLPPGDGGEDDERLSAAFDALHELSSLRTAAEGLDFAVRLLEDFVPSTAISACLYDINTDQLRFVALSGPGKAERQGAAVPRSAGLIGQAARAEQMALVIADVRAQPRYDADVDGRAGMFVDNMLLRSIVHEGQLFGVLQLINRDGGAFQAGDVHVVSYVADGLARFLHELRTRRRA